MWKQLGLAVPTEPAIGGQDEAKECLHTILDGSAFGHSLKHLLMKAMDGDEETGFILRTQGLWAVPEEDGFIVANRCKALEAVLEGTKWHNAMWSYTLRRLAGAMPSMPRRYEAGSVSRGTFLPSRVLDMFIDA